jgi:hypothetical protein
MTLEIELTVHATVDVITNEDGDCDILSATINDPGLYEAFGDICLDPKNMSKEMQKTIERAVAREFE